MIKCLILRPKKTPKVIEIENTLEDLQKQVEGYIEILRPNNHIGVVLVVNEEGWLKKLPYNRYIQGQLIVGNILVIGEEDGDFISLTDKQIKEYKKLYGSKSFV